MKKLCTMNCGPCMGDTRTKEERMQGCEDCVDAPVDAPTQEPNSYIDYQQRRGAHADIIDEALATYDQFMLDDDFDSQGALDRIMKRMRDRAVLYTAPLAQQPARDDVLYRAIRFVENWPLEAKNMEVAERYAKHGWANAVAGVLQTDIVAGLRALKSHPQPPVQGVTDDEDMPSGVIEALKFYAEGCHFHQHDPIAWDTVSGEPQNFYEDESNTATVEDGSVAKLALEKYNAALSAAPAQEKMSDEEIAAIYKRTFEGMPDCARSAPTNLPPLIFAFARAVRGEEEDK